jgi:hypothetical protein
VSEIFYSLAILACPVGMGLMMWFMMRGMNSAPAAAPAQDAELARMRAEIDQLRAAERGSATAGQ